MIEKVRKTRKKGELTAKIYQVWGKILTILVSRTSLNTQKRAKNEISVKLTGGYIVMTLNKIYGGTKWPGDKMAGGQCFRGQTVRGTKCTGTKCPDT